MIKKTYTIKTSVSEVWQALVDPTIIKKWSGSSANMSANVGEEFSLWDDSIWGKNIEVAKEKLLVQEWYGGKWEKPSIVTIELQSKSPGVTEVLLKHENVPTGEENDFDHGWDDYYFGAINEFLES